MATHSRIPDAAMDELPCELSDLEKVIATIPPQHRKELDLAYEKVVDSVRRRRRILSLVQEALAQLRLDIKYLMFDLEVTRKERDTLREQAHDD